jgi:hypothetical protein
LAGFHGTGRIAGILPKREKFFRGLPEVGIKLLYEKKEKDG